MGEVIVGAEALAAGKLTRYQLQRRYRLLFPGVFVPRDAVPTLRDRTYAAWLWSKRRAVVPGLAASTLHGASWIDRDIPVELVLRKGRPHPGIVIRDDGLGPGEVARVGGVPVTTASRTAFDLGRRLGRDEAVTRLDALAWSTRYAVADVRALIDSHPGVRNLRRLPAVLDLVDAGAASPKETWLRLLLIDAGLPRPETQIPVVDGWRTVGILDMGWPTALVAAEYDGDHHRTDRRQYVKDIRRHRELERLGWLVVRVVAEDRPAEVVDRVRGRCAPVGFVDFLVWCGGLKTASLQSDHLTSTERVGYWWAGNRLQPKSATRMKTYDECDHRYQLPMRRRPSQPSFSQAPGSSSRTARRETSELGA